MHWKNQKTMMNEDDKTLAERRKVTDFLKKFCEQNDPFKTIEDN